MTDTNTLLANELPYARFLVLELAAVLDRLSRPDSSGQPPLNDPRADRLRESLTRLSTDRTRDDRVEAILRLLSDDA